MGCWMEMPSGKVNEQIFNRMTDLILSNKLITRKFLAP